MKNGRYTPTEFRKVVEWRGLPSSRAQPDMYLRHHKKESYDEDDVIQYCRSNEPVYHESWRGRCADGQDWNSEYFSAAVIHGLNPVGFSDKNAKRCDTGVYPALVVPFSC